LIGAFFVLYWVLLAVLLVVLPVACRFIDEQPHNAITQEQPRTGDKPEPEPVLVVLPAAA
jgi:predicted secreted protein